MLLWPALVAASASEIAASTARQFAELALPDTRPPAGEPKWATPNTVALELQTVRLRDFSTASEGTPALLCAPLALHGAGLVDLAPHHSLVGALCNAGLKRIFVTDWRSASPEMRFLGIDDYLADLNVLIDHLGGRVDLVGLCQGGWMALMYAARFPAKVRRLVLAGAPVDIAGGQSGLSTLADATHPVMFHGLVELGDGRVLGHRVCGFWGPETVGAEEVRQVLETPEAAGSSGFSRLEALFRDWHARTIDLPGTYYLEVVEKLYRRNDLAAGRFVALGQRIDLAAVRTPIFMLAARDDELVAPAQLFATERLVGTAADKMRKAMAPCRHAGLFVGRTVLGRFWPRIARWLLDPGDRKHGGASAPHGRVQVA